MATAIGSEDVLPGESELGARLAAGLFLARLLLDGGLHELHFVSHVVPLTPVYHQGLTGDPPRGF